MDTNRIKEIAQEIEGLEEELRQLVLGVKERKPTACSVCKQEGHTARNCPQKT